MAGGWDDGKPPSQLISRSLVKAEAENLPSHDSFECEQGALRESGIVPDWALVRESLSSLTVKNSH